MRSRLLLSLLLVLAPAAALAQIETPNTVTFTASEILKGAGGTPEPDGTQICVMTTDANDVPASYRVGISGGHTAMYPTEQECATSTGGVIPPMTVLNSAMSNPLNACLRVTEVAPDGHEIARFKCVQTGTTAALGSWCNLSGSVETCNFDVYPLGSNIVPLVQVGPAPNIAIGTVTSGSSPAATLTGASPNYTLNLQLQQGPPGSGASAGSAIQPGSVNGVKYASQSTNGCVSTSSCANTAIATALATANSYTVADMAYGTTETVQGSSWSSACAKAWLGFSPNLCGSTFANQTRVQDIRGAVIVETFNNPVRPDYAPTYALGDPRNGGGTHAQAKETIIDFDEDMGSGNTAGEIHSFRAFAGGHNTNNIGIPLPSGASMSVTAGKTNFVANEYEAKFYTRGQHGLTQNNMSVTGVGDGLLFGTSYFCDSGRHDNSDENCHFGDWNVGQDAQKAHGTIAASPAVTTGSTSMVITPGTSSDGTSSWENAGEGRYLLDLSQANCGASGNGGSLTDTTYWLCTGNQITGGSGWSYELYGTGGVDPLASNGGSYISSASGATLSGSTGQNCTVTGFTGNYSGATATVALSGTNSLAAVGGLYPQLTITSSPLTVSPPSGSVTVTLGSGTATCSGTATVSQASNLTFIASLTAPAGTFVAPTASTLSTSSIYPTGSSWTPGSTVVSVASSSGFSAGNACITDKAAYEQVQITHVGTNQLTIVAEYGHYPGALITQGGECGDALSQNADLTKSGTYGSKDNAYKALPVASTSSDGSTLYYWTAPGGSPVSNSSNVNYPAGTTNWAYQQVTNATASYSSGTGLVTVTCSGCMFYSAAGGIAGFESQGTYGTGKFPNINGQSATFSDAVTDLAYNQSAVVNVTSNTTLTYAPTLASATGNTTSASASVTLTSSTSGIAIGDGVTGPGIPSSTTVSNLVGSTLTLSANATATASGVTLSFTPNTSVTSLSVTYCDCAFTLYPFAEVLTVYNPATKSVDGTVTLASNAVPWAYNDHVTMPVYVSNAMEPTHDYFQWYTPSSGAQGWPHPVYAGRVTGNLTGWGVDNNASTSIYQGYGGTNPAPLHAFETSGWWHYGLDMAVAPEEAVINVGCKPKATVNGIVAGGCSDAYFSGYHFAQLGSNLHSNADLDFIPYTDTWSFTNQAQSYLVNVGEQAIVPASSTTVGSLTCQGVISPCVGIYLPGSEGAYIQNAYIGNLTFGTCSACGGSSLPSGTNNHVLGFLSGVASDMGSGIVTNGTSTVGIGGSGYTNTVSGTTNINTTTSAGQTNIGNSSNYTEIYGSVIAMNAGMTANGVTVNPTATATSGTTFYSSNVIKLTSSVYLGGGACNQYLQASLNMTSATVGSYTFGPANSACNGTTPSYYFNAASGIFAYTKMPSQETTANITGTTTFAGGTNVGTPTCTTTCSDADGTISFATTASISSGATLATITFGATWPAAPNCVFSPATAASIGQAYLPTASTSSFTLNAGTTIASGTTLVYAYVCRK